jgi:YD repeat-containing protein
MTKHTNQDAKDTLYQYDNANRVWKVTDAKLGVTEFGYNARSFRTMVKDAKGQIYNFDFDAMGRPTTTTRGGVTMTYGYQNGLRTSRNDYNGAVTNYVYDELNRLQQIQYAGGGGASFTYDEVSNLRTATNVNGTVSFNYDARDRLGDATDAWGRLHLYAYDKNSNRTLTHLAGAPGSDPGLSLTYGYDSINRLQTVDQSGVSSATFGYDAVNRLRSRALPNGVNVTADYDDLDRLKTLNYAKGTTTLANFQYGYNVVNQIEQMIDGAGTHTFGYDELQRLTAATHPNQAAENYSYDEVGNRTASHVAASYAYQTPNRVMQIGGTTFEYDGNGNLKKKINGSSTTTYSYDLENRLTSVMLPSLKIIHSEYSTALKAVASL